MPPKARSTICSTRPCATRIPARSRSARSSFPDTPERTSQMARILVLYYSSYGHIAQMAEAVADGVRGAGHECDIRRVPETAPAEVVKAAGFSANENHAV